MLEGVGFCELGVLGCRDVGLAGARAGWFFVARQRSRRGSRDPIVQQPSPVTV